MTTKTQQWLDKWVNGPTRLRWERIPLQAGDAAPDLALPDYEGKQHRLSEAWSGGPGLLLFWRHYGCSCGRERAARLQEEYGRYVELGAHVLIMGYGDPARAAEYARRNRIPCPILCDPGFEAYKAYDVLEGKPSQVVFDAEDGHLRCEVDAWRNLVDSRQGTERAIVANPWQLPGEFVIDQRGVVRLAYRYQYCEDWPDPRVLYSAIKEAKWANE
ncbi:MAG: peroxiredoxin-like family protein [Anaerolineales bacterium]